MPRLSPAEMGSRLAFDYQAAMPLNGSLIRVSAHRSFNDAWSGRVPITNVQQGHMARAYLAIYRFDTLVGPNQRRSHNVVAFDLLAGGNYPYSSPAATTKTRPVPWTPHFNPENGQICLGMGWSEAKGEMLFAHLLMHVARLLNFDEPPLREGGYQTAAAHYWKHVLRSRPLNPNLRYPRLPSEVTHGTRPARRPAVLRIRSAPTNHRPRPVMRIRRSSS